MYVCMKLLNKIWPTILRTKFIFIWYLKTVKEKEYYYRNANAKYSIYINL